MKNLIEKIGKKAIIILVMFIILVIVILFGGAFVYNKFFYKKTYNEVETIMLDAGKSYYSDHSDRLPKELNGKISISASALAKADKMKTISEYLKDDDIKCSGHVDVTNLGSNYRYVSKLDCGDNYKTKTFLDYLNKNNSVVTDGDGLYNLNDTFVFRGDNVNNYVRFYTQKDDYKKKYRIVKFTGDYIELIYTENIDTTAWDDRYNIEKDNTVGINDYNVSSIKKYLQDLYDGKTIFNSYAKNLIIPHSISLGKRDDNDTDKSGSLENATILENQYIGLLPLSDFLNASLDKNCTSSISASCQNYNYLSKFVRTWWTATASKKNSYQVYKISGKNYGYGGYSSLSTANSKALPRFVVYVSRDAMFVSGDGTKKNPYIIK